ncbi:MAG: metal ABC transporter solute-binding protein, Zn/Mn family [Brachymonas sp.]
MNLPHRSTNILYKLLISVALLVPCIHIHAAQTTTVVTSDRNAPIQVVASTSWVAAFAKAAGVTKVSLVAPANLQHPPDYDPKPSDLAAVAKADYVLVAGVEGFAARMKEASGSKAEVIYLHVDNQPENIRKQVMFLAGKFGTQKAATAWLARFDKRIAQLQEEIVAAVPTPAPKAVSNVWMAYWVPFANMRLVGTYGPKPATASELARLFAIKPDFIIINGHTQGNNLFDDFSAKKIIMYNFPPENDIDLIAIFERNTQAVIKALKK